ncbi:hypothetical protein PT2222_60310 [Paraburkholderia tropica]
MNISISNDECALQNGEFDRSGLQAEGIEACHSILEMSIQGVNVYWPILAIGARIGRVRAS